MNSNRVLRIKELFQAAVDLPAEQRDDYLISECNGDESLRAQVEKLIAASGGSPCTETHEHADPARSVEPNRPRKIGQYRILDTLGEGGMGVVYLAEQKEPIRRRVALKVIKHGMTSKQVLGRFELERQALAVMNHPAIAKVFEAGTTAAGQPYFVMEFVEGISITDYCDQHKLPLKDRIHIFQQACRGVTHAHQKGILHRDLKPSNILVARKDDQHFTKIIDFGLARATDHQLVQDTIYTEQGQFMGTPEYMSPEQAGVNTLDIDTRTDIYSLGVILYELLTGELPFSSAELRKAGLLEIQEILRKKEPKKPSTRISTVGEMASESAQMRRLSPSALRSNLRGDLDWIVMRAMAKEPERRYESATNLALDLSRYLDHEPVLAGPPSTRYRMKKFVRRYRGQVVTAAAAMLLISSGSVLFTISLANERNRALQAELEVRDLLKEMRADARLAAREALVDNDLAKAERRLASVPSELRKEEWRKLRIRLHTSFEVSLIPRWLALDAVAHRPEYKRHYFFRGPYSHRRDADQPISQPMTMDADGQWADFPERWAHDGINACVFVAASNDYHFFRLSETARWDKGLVKGLKESTVEWGEEEEGVTFPWEGYVDAVAHQLKPEEQAEKPSPSFLQALFSDKPEEVSDVYYFFKDDQFTTKPRGGRVNPNPRPLSDIPGFPQRGIKGAIFNQSRLYLFYSDSYAWYDIGTGERPEESPIAYESVVSEFRSDPYETAVLEVAAEPAAKTHQSLVPPTALQEALATSIQHRALMNEVASIAAKLSRSPTMLASLSHALDEAVEGSPQPVRHAQNEIRSVLNSKRIGRLRESDPSLVFDAVSVAVGGTVRGLPSTMHGVVSTDSDRTDLIGEIRGRLAGPRLGAKNCVVSVLVQHAIRPDGSYVTVAVPLERPSGETVEGQVYLSLPDYEFLGLGVGTNSPKPSPTPRVVHAGYTWAIE